MRSTDDNPFPFLKLSDNPNEIGRIDKYIAKSVIGHGGMGYVFLAEDTELGRQVALKVLKPELAVEDVFRKRFLVEARSAASLNSDYVVTVFQVGESGDVPFLAMQLLRGETLQDRLQRECPLPYGFAAIILRHVAEGLFEAHNNGLVHRDMKPANIWLETDSSTGHFRRARILDFGLARLREGNNRLTAHGMIVGTPHYMAPEQADGKELDGRADLFALGCVGYTMLTGEMAFDGTSTMAVLNALATHIPESIARKNPKVPIELVTLIEDMMAKSVTTRPTSAHEVMARLDKILAEIPVDHLPMSRSGLVGALDMTRHRHPTQTIKSHDTPKTSDPFKAVENVETNPDHPAGVDKASLIANPSTSLVPESALKFDDNTTAEKTPPHGSPSLVNTTFDLQKEKPSRRKWLFSVGGIGLAAVGAGYWLWNPSQGSITEDVNPPVTPPSTPAGPPIVVGILHSTSGPSAARERPVLDATMLALNELNNAGGLLGREIEPKVVDGKSDPEEFAKQAGVLLAIDKVSALFGCFSSASRREVRPIVERHKSLLFYPAQSEGMELSQHIVHLGPVPNQQMVPAVEFVSKQLEKKRIFLVGFDDIFCRASNETLKDTVKAFLADQGTRVVGEAYLMPDTDQVAMAIRTLRSSDADVVISTLSGSANLALCKALKESKDDMADIPVVSISLMEGEIQSADTDALTNEYVVGNYFQSIRSPSGNEFARKIRSTFGPERTITDPMMAAYSGVKLWAKAVESANSLDAEGVVKALKGSSIVGPAGEIKIDSETLYTWQPARIGQIGVDGNIKEVQGTFQFLQPEPYPPTRTRNSWNQFVNQLYKSWGNHWQA